MSGIVEHMKDVEKIQALALKLAKAYCEFVRAYENDNDDLEECKKNLDEIHKAFVGTCIKLGIVETWTM